MNRLIVTAFLVVAGCGPSSSLEPFEPPPLLYPPTPPVSFRSDVMPVLKAKCAGCHSGQYENPATTFTRLNAHTAAMGACANRPRIVINDGAGSLLVRKLNGTTDCGAVMPLIKMGTATMPCAGSECVAEADIGKVKTWIDEGAQDN